MGKIEICDTLDMQLGQVLEGALVFTGKHLCDEEKVRTIKNERGVSVRKSRRYRHQWFPVRNRVGELGVQNQAREGYESN